MYRPPKTHDIIIPSVKLAPEYIQAVKAGSGEVLGWKIIKNCAYYSKRYDKYILLNVTDALYNGADYAKDIVSFSHPLHDVLCRDTVFADSSKCSNWQASHILKDVLKLEKYWFRARTWFIFTFIGGGKKLSKF